MTKCKNKACTKSASFGMPDSNMPVYCATHKKSYHEYIISKTKITTTDEEETETEKPSHNKRRTNHGIDDHIPIGLDYIPSTERLAPTLHHHIEPTDGMKQKRQCSHEGCTKAPSYGLMGDTEGKWCFAHKPTTAVMIKNSIEDRNKSKLRGFHCTTKADKKDDHVPLGLSYVPYTERSAPTLHHNANEKGHKHCRHGGCTKAPSYGLIGDREGSWCCSHKPSTAVLIRSSSSTAKRKDELEHVPRGLDPGPPAMIANHHHGHHHHYHEELDFSVVLADAEKVHSPPVNELEARKFIEDIYENHIDIRIAIKYLLNIVNHDDIKFRCIKLSNSKFRNEVWLSPTIRNLFISLGFVKNQPHIGYVTLNPLTDETQQIIRILVQDLLIKTNHMDLMK